MYLKDDMVYDQKYLKITKENLYKHAFSNIDLLTDKPVAIVIEFHGLGSQGSLRKAGEYQPQEITFAKSNLLTLMPYYGFWSWMNDNSAGYVDMIVKAVCEMTGVDPQKIPLISAGTSMGGLSAIMYSKKSAFSPDACFASCPATDLVAVAAHPDRDDFIRTVYSTYGGENIEETLRLNSPYHMVPHLPKIPYYVIYGGADITLLPELHIEKFAVRMREYGHDITVIESPETGHGYPNGFPAEVRGNYYQAILDFCVK